MRCLVEPPRADIRLLLTRWGLSILRVSLCLRQDPEDGPTDIPEIGPGRLHVAPTQVIQQPAKWAQEDLVLAAVPK
jgi:hypothetical protein